jgi:hypothetical protein
MWTLLPPNTPNPDRYMSDLRQILSQGRKRIGLLVGAGAPTAIRLSGATGKIDEAGEALIPDVTHLTEFVIGSLKERNAIVVDEGRTRDRTGIFYRTRLMLLRSSTWCVGAERGPTIA